MFGFFTFYRGAVISAEVFYRTAELPRVTGSNLDPQKHWNQAECFSKEKNTFCSASGSRGLGFRVSCTFNTK